jgi:sulfur carrier protein ThiS
MIQVSVKLFSGLDATARIVSYDSDRGLILDFKDGVRVKKVLRSLGLYPREALVVFVNGRKASLKDKLENGDVLFCMKPVSGG